MYYEIFEELKYCDNTNTLSNTSQLVNKSFIDSFFEIRSQINPIYNETEDYKRLVGNNYSYLFYQKIISGIAKSIFLGFNSLTLKEPIFLPSGRIKIPSQNLQFHFQNPTIFFNSWDLSYSNSSIQTWEDELFGISHDLNSKLKLSISREGFRANLYRILEILFSMKSSSQKRRTNWTVFLHEFIILQKKFSLSDIQNLGLSVMENSPFFYIVDPSFPVLNYLEFAHLHRLGTVNTESIKITPLSGTSIEKYSQFNSQIQGRLPICHFHLNEHMFVYKEEFSLSQYVEFFIHPWSKSREIFLTYIENDTHQINTLSLSDFTDMLAEMKYALILSFHEMRDNSKIFFSAEPRMIKY